MHACFRTALLSFLFAHAAGAASLASTQELPPPDDAAEPPANWTLSSGELSASCTSGLCHSGGRTAPADDPVFQFANAAGSEAAVALIAPRPGTRKDGAPVPAGIGSVPEPETYALLCGGLLLLGGLARRHPRP
jgi:hypothetical protein